MSIRVIIFLFIGSMIFGSCREQNVVDNSTLFVSLDAAKTGVDFSNDLVFTEEYNPYTFKNFFNGGGVALGDVNNDGLTDIYLTGNLSNNKLYINKGDMRFDDVTDKAGLACKGVWSTGAAMVDINGDGLLDIYVCKSGMPGGDHRHNELFINKGNLTFDEQAAEYGLDFNGLSTHSAFFDYDRDGDLDCYLLNNSTRSVGGYDIIEGQRNNFDTLGGNRLLRHDVISGKSTFVDVSQAAGIYGSAIGFGLGVSISDLNDDQWPDMFVSNDFFEKDYLYINQKDGTFREVVDKSITELSLGSMGADIMDINNDLHSDIFVTEMLPSDPIRYKTKAIFENWDKYNLNHKKGYHRQFGRNVLNINVGLDSQNNPLYSEISRYAGVSATDWSWGALMNDFNNDRKVDIFVANGIYKDLTDLDYVNFEFDEMKIKQMIAEKKEVITTMMKRVPSHAQRNALFIQGDSLLFEDKSMESGLTSETFSNGSAYGDLDNDGDLDLVINNINQKASILQNNTMSGHSMTLSLVGAGMNTQSIGSKVICYTKSGSLMREVFPMRGFESCVESDLWFGLGNDDRIDSLEIFWPDGKYSMLTSLNDVDTNYIIDYKKVSFGERKIGAVAKTMFTISDWLTSYRHIENEYSDFDRDRLLPFMKSNEGPVTKVIDLDGDGLEDIIVGASIGKEPILMRQVKGGKFVEQVLKTTDKGEVSDILVEDFNGDKKLDVYLTMGGAELPGTSSAIKDKLFIQSKGTFVLNDELIDIQYHNGASAVFIDVNGDAKNDIIVFGRQEPFNYGVPASGCIYLQSQGRFRYDQISSMKMKDFGMVSKALKLDIDNDGKSEIVCSMDMGEIRVLDVASGRIVEKAIKGLTNINGMWTSITTTDIDSDGDPDILVGNKGLNNRMAHGYGSYQMHINDFDGNGQIEQISCYLDKNGKIFSLNTRDDIVKQMPVVKKSLLKYSDFAATDIESMFGANITKRSIVYQINEWRSGVFINDKGLFTLIPFPYQVQWSDVRAICTLDFNNDGLLDVMVGGNQYNAKPEMGIDAASRGGVILQGKNHIFTYVNNRQSGLYLDGQVRSMATININNEKKVVAFRNNDKPLLINKNK